MKKLLFILALIPIASSAQDYVDLFTIAYGQTLGNDFENSTEQTEVKSLEADLTFPVVLSEKSTLITGFIFSRNELDLFPSNFNVPQGNFPGFELPTTRLFSSTLKLGLATNHSEKWSSVLVLLPKIASDYKGIEGSDFLIGGIGIMKYQKSENLLYKFGLYLTQEHFGTFTTPIFGLYYTSQNDRLEIDLSLPIAGDINYTIEDITLGFDYIGIGRSFNINENDGGAYVDVSSLEFSPYVQYNLFDESVLLRAKFGYASTDYEVYQKDDTIDLGVSAFAFGDDRTQLNPTISGSLFAKLEAVYRFNISSEEKKSPE